MYKLFINGIQIGNFKTMKDLTVAIITGCCCRLGRGVRFFEWKGKTLRIRTIDD